MNSRQKSLIASVSVLLVFGLAPLTAAHAFSSQQYELTCTADKIFPLDDPIVRQALSLAVDKQDIIDRHYEGEGQSTPTFMIPFIGWAYNDDPELQEFIAYDPEKAGQMLDDAGYTATFDKGGEMWRFDGWDIRILVGNHDERRYKSAITVCSYFTAIGVNCHIVTTSFNLILIDVYDQGAFEIYVGGFGVGIDPATWILDLIGEPGVYRTPNYDTSDDGFNGGSWIHEEFNELGKVAQSTTDLAVRAANYKKMQEILAYEQPAYNYYVSDVTHALTNTFGGYRPGTGLQGPWDHNSIRYIYQGAEPSYGGELFIGTVADIDAMHTWLSTTLYTQYMTGQIWSSLLDLDADNNPIPDLATSVPEGSIDEARGVWTTTFELREGVKWHDGTPFTADDVVFTYDLFQKHPELNGWTNYDFDGDVETKEVVATAIDDYHVRIDVSMEGEAYIYAPFYLSTAQLFIMPKHILDGVEDWKVSDYSTKAPIGTGPFMLDSYVSGEFIRFTRNPDYYISENGNMLPYLDAVTWKFYPDDVSSIAAYLGGEIDDHGFQLTPSQREEITEEAEKIGMDISMSVRPDTGFRHVTYNVESICVPDPEAFRRAGVETTTEPITIITTVTVPEITAIMTTILLLSSGIPIILLVYKRRKDI